MIEMIQYDEYSTINAEEATKIFSLIENIYKRNEEMMKEWSHNKNVVANGFLTFDEDQITLVDVFQQINNIFKLTGKEEPFAKIEEVLETEINKSKEFLNNHDDCYHIGKMYEMWEGEWKSDPYINFHERIHAIRAINYCIEYAPNVFEEGELSILNSLLKIERSIETI